MAGRMIQSFHVYLNFQRNFKMNQTSTKENIDNSSRYNLRVAFMNIMGQSGLQVCKQIQIEAFIRHNACDILHLQEVNINSESFSTCDYIVHIL